MTSKEEKTKEEIKLTLKLLKKEVSEVVNGGMVYDPIGASYWSITPEVVKNKIETKMSPLVKALKNLIEPYTINIHDKSILLANIDEIGHTLNSCCYHLGRGKPKQRLDTQNIYEDFKILILGMKDKIKNFELNLNRFDLI